jgi:inner membrane transporter RhtA
VAWLRIASAAVVFALWRRPWRLVSRLGNGQRRVLLALGVVLGAMNSLFYLAVDRLPLSTVGAIEFLGTVILAAVGARTRRNLLALALAVGGVAALTDVRLTDQPLGFVFAFANCAGFMLYVVLGHRIANTTPDDDAGRDRGGLAMHGIDQLGAAMLVAAVAATPFGIGGALPAFLHLDWLLWGIGVGLCFLGDPLCHRPAGHGPGHLRADAGDPAGDRNWHRPGRARAGPHPAGPARHRPGRRRGRAPPRPLGG